MNLTQPDVLEKGDLISFVSPSAGLAELFPHRVEKAIENLKSLGFRVRVEKNARNRHGWVSGSVEERVEDLHAAFSDPEVKAIICMIGGDHSNQLLRSIDFDLIRNNPKVFMGYSDITVLHHAFQTKAGLQTYYGPCVISEIGEYPDILPFTKEHIVSALMEQKTEDITASEEWTDQFLDWFEERNHTKARDLYPNMGHQWWREGEVSASITGGCVPSVNHVIGTEYWIDHRDKIFFIDLPEGSAPGKGLDVSSLDSYLADLQNHGVFEEIAGLIIGRPYQYSEEDTKMLKEIVYTYTEDTEYPILFNANIGHASPMIVVKMGKVCTLNSHNNQFTLS